MSLQERVRAAFEHYSSEIALNQVVTSLLGQLAEEEKTPEAASSGLRTSGNGLEQYFWIEFAMMFARDPGVADAVREVIRRHDNGIANHLLLEILAESRDVSCVPELIFVIQHPFPDDETDSLARQAMQVLACISPAALAGVASDAFVGRPNLELTWRELTEPDAPRDADE